MKLSDWARADGVTSKAGWKGEKAGRWPVPARQMPAGTILEEVALVQDVIDVLNGYARAAPFGRAAGGA